MKDLLNTILLPVQYPSMEMCLCLAFMLFIVGMIGVLLNSKNIIKMLMSIELMLLAVSINFVTFSVFMMDVLGQIFVLFILTISAAEVAIGLAILVVYFRHNESVSADDICIMNG